MRVKVTEVNTHTCARRTRRRETGLPSTDSCFRWTEGWGQARPKPGARTSPGAPHEGQIISAVFPRPQQRAGAVLEQPGLSAVPIEGADVSL